MVNVMRRILLIVAMLLLATAPAMATVTVRAIQSQPNNALGQYTTADRDCKALDINYTCSAGEEVRAFALEVTLDNGFYFSDITNYKRGESNSVSPGYGIFPGSFRTALNPTDINWQDPNYRPVASQNDPDGAGTGLGTQKVILEMGSLYVGDGNKPSSAGTLCRLWVDPNRTCTPADCNMTLSVNTLRGGVVDPNGNTITPTIVNGKFRFPKRFPCWSPYKTQYNEWLSIWEPNCWAGPCWSSAWPYQCLGDADGKVETLNKYRCYTSDYTKLMQCWGRKATLLRAGMGADGNTLCADFDHKSETLNKYRCYTSDYTKMMLCWGKKETSLRQFNPPCPRSTD